MSQETSPSLTQLLIDRSNEASARRAGRSLRSELGLLPLSPEQERALAETPSIPTFQVPLQDPETGRFKFRPTDDGTLEAGDFYIDELGRFVSVTEGS